VPDRGSFELIKEDAGDAVRVIVLRGDADRFRAEAVGRAIQAARDDDRDVVVDLSQATYMDSSMLATFVAASEQGRLRDRELVLVVQTPRLKRSLEVKGLAGILRVADSRDQAVDLLLSERADPDAGASPERPRSP
jgi:anti-sigma B factor antagonist